MGVSLSGVGLIFMIFCLSDNEIIQDGGQSFHERE